MKRISRMLAVILGAGLLVVVGLMFAPRTAHALIATLVDVTRNEENPARQPFQAFANGIADLTGDCAATLPVAGTGQRTVIEYVSFVVTSNTTGTKLVTPLITPTVGGFSVKHVLAPTYQADDGVSQTWEASQVTRFYADTPVHMEVRGPASLAGASCYFTYSGHLVNLP
jgi:hypothetical protein